MNRRSKILKSPKLIEKKRAKIIKIALIYLFFVVISFGGTFFALRMDNIQITKINSNVPYSNDIANKVNTILSGNYLYLFPKSNIWLYPKSEIKDALLGSFNSIDNLSIQANGLSSLDIIINERLPVALFCEGFNTDTDNSNCYYLDNRGFIYAKSASSTNTTLFKYFMVNRTSDSLIGQNIFDENDKFVEINNFIDLIKKSGLTITGLLIGDDGQYELYAKNNDYSEMIVYFDNRISLDKIATNLIAFIEDSKVKKNGNNGKINFESINLRFGNNIFYVTK